MAFNDTGTLIIRTYTASGALPVPGSIVRIYGVDEENRFVEYSIITDIDGISESISLPAPSKVYSQSPSSPEASYALYNLEITAPGYYTKKINNVSVFDGIQTIQLINMIPININENNTMPPENNLNTDAQEMHQAE